VNRARASRITKKQDALSLEGEGQGEGEETRQTDMEMKNPETLKKIKRRFV
jgi:hypothetical protein